MTGSERTRLLFVSYRDPMHPQAGGASIHVDEVAKRLVMRGYDVSRVCMSFGGAKEVESLQGVVTVRSGNMLTFYLMVWLEAIRLRASYDFLVEEVGSGGLPTFILALTGKPGLVLAIQMQRQVFFSELPLPLAVFATTMESFYLILCRFRKRVFVVNSRSVKHRLVSLGIQAERIRVDPPSIGPDFSIVSEGAGKIRRENVILVLGRVRKYKCTDQAVKAFSLIQSRISNYKLLIIGRPTSTRYLARLRELIKRLGMEGRVILRGYAPRTEVKSALQSAKLLLYLSKEEGFGMAAIEAASAGTPVIAYDVTGLRDSVAEGKTGVLVPFGDIHALSEAILNIIGDEALYCRLSQEGPSWAQRFDWETTVDIFDSVIRETSRRT